MGLQWTSDKRALLCGFLLGGWHGAQRWSRTRARSSVRDVRGTSRVVRKARLASWEELIYEAEETGAGKELAILTAKRGEGLVPHTDAEVRYFGEARTGPRVTIFRDQAGWCPYCQKVWLMLEEKRVDYKIVKVPMRSYGEKPRSFLSKVPNGLLPAMEIDGRLMTESLDIMVTIERTFPDPEKPMIPREEPLLGKAQELLNLERELFGAWCSYLFRPEIPFVGGGEREFTSALKKVDSELGRNTHSPFFLPYSWPSLVDMQYVSHMERCVASALYYKGYDIRKRFPNIDRWLAAYETLPHYMATKSDYYTHCMDIPPQYGYCFSNDSDLATAARSAIEPAKLRVPLSLRNDFEPLTVKQLETPEEHYRIEAAWKLAHNHKAVARFCSRAAGPDVGAWASGNPTKCELADPLARPNEDVVLYVDAVLRSVAATLLGDHSMTLRDALEVALQGSEKKSPPSGWGEVANCIAYLRDRVGSPRDMSMPAAKLFRAHLNEAVAALRT